jgi:anti-sigma factor RsiW
MDFARFETLVAAYGATPNRWPEEERAAAEAFARTDARAADLLSQADAIDALLFAHHVAEPSRTLRAMVLESAPKRRRIVTRVRLWWAGLVLALTAAGGVLAGSAAAAALDPVTANVQLYPRDDVPSPDVPEENAL